MISINTSQIRLPWWTWIAPYILIVAGDKLSLYFFQDSITSSFYLPAAIGIVLIYWWGPVRVIPAVFIVTTLNNLYYGFNSYAVWMAFGISDSFAVLLSWLLFLKLFKGKFWLPDTRNTVVFFLIGLAVPILWYVVNWQFFYIMDNKMVWGDFVGQFRRDILSELIVNSVVVIPVLFYFSPLLSRRKLILAPPIPKTNFNYTNPVHVIETIVVAILLLLLIMNFNFEDIWFVLGAISLYVAIRFGFDAVLLTNIFVFLFTYLAPAIHQPIFTARPVDENIRIFFGYLLLFLFSTLTGRVISDLRMIQHQLNHQNEKLTQTNLELDRFVYSASHDMSAPLKSIRGLVHMGRLTHPNEDQQLCFNKIETSVSRLETFIQEVLDYSRNNRTEVVPEKVNLKEICEEVFNGLRYLDEVSEPTLQMDESVNVSMVTDRSRLRIIINNLLSNAIKYQKKDYDHSPVIKISAGEVKELLKIVIRDNGEGIKPDILPDIFTMFFRGNLNSSGSGLGLYIAKEAATRMGGNILVKSEYGIGSEFVIEIPFKTIS